MRQSSAKWCTAIAGLAALSILLLFSPTDAAQPSPTAIPDDCGVPVTAWGAATADEITVDLLSTERRDVVVTSSPSASPTANPSANYFAELRIQNIGTSAATVVVNDILVVLCDGTIARPVQERDGIHAALPDAEIAAQTANHGWVAYVLPTDNPPVRLIVPVSRPGLSGGRVEFALTNTHLESNTGGTQGANGADGADAIGGNAVGGDGSDGADATPESNT